MRHTPDNNKKSSFYSSWLSITYHLNFNLLITLRHVNKQLQDISYDPSIWKQMFLLHFPDEAYNLQLKKYQGDKTKIDYYSMFVNCYKLRYEQVISADIRLFIAVIERDLPSLRTHGLRPYKLLTVEDSKEYNPLFFAIKNKSQELLDYIYSSVVPYYHNDQQKIDVNKRDKFVKHTILHWATYCNQIEQVQYLLSIKADANVRRGDAYGDPPIHFAALGGYEEVAKLLLQAKADPNRASLDDGVHALYIATKHGHSKIVELLIEHKANTNLTKADGTSTLHVAVQVGRLDTASLLLEHKAKVNAVDENGIASVHLAAQNGFHDVLQLLINYKADINLRHEASGVTALFLATQNSHQDVTKLLLNNKADANIYQQNGRSSLFNAVKNNDKIIIENLLEHNADVNVKTENGTSVFDITEESDILDLLEKSKQILTSAN